MTTPAKPVASRQSFGEAVLAMGRENRNIVVLDADPIADIKNTRRISWVIQDGKMAKAESYLPKR